jgi:hypothetical protein
MTDLRVRGKIWRENGGFLRGTQKKSEREFVFMFLTGIRRRKCDYPRGMEDKILRGGKGTPKAGNEKCGGGMSGRENVGEIAQLWL